MTAAQADVEQAWQTIDALPPAGREIILARLANKKANEKAFSSTKTLLEDERFLISFEDYLALSDDERDEIQSLAYEKYGSWIDEKLEQLHAQWMLVCGGKLIECSAKLQDYPSDERMSALGKQLGYAPLVFVANLRIEESLWAALRRDDFYPSLTVTISSVDSEQADLSKKGITFDADFDTGSPYTSADYELLRANKIIEKQTFKPAQTDRHLGFSYQYHVLPARITIADETGRMLSKVTSVICVRNWQNSPLCLVNPVRKALVGRNLLYEFPLRIELDGGERTTKILAAST